MPTYTNLYSLQVIITGLWRLRFWQQDVIIWISISIMADSRFSSIHIILKTMFVSLLSKDQIRLEFQRLKLKTSNHSNNALFSSKFHRESSFSQDGVASVKRLGKLAFEFLGLKSGNCKFVNIDRKNWNFVVYWTYG